LGLPRTAEVNQVERVRSQALVLGFSEIFTAPREGSERPYRNDRLWIICLLL